MASKKSAADPGVTAYTAALDHPLKPALEAVRQAILGADPAIAEGIKWNMPSFRTVEYFATTNLTGKTGLRLILHTGAKVKASAATGLDVDDPSGLLEWLAKDRALARFDDVADVKAKRAALQAIIRAWIKLL